MYEPFPPSIRRRVIHIPKVGGPLIETTLGDQVSLQLGEGFQPDDPAPVRVPRVLALCLVTTIGVVVGWMGHAMVLS